MKSCIRGLSVSLVALGFLGSIVSCSSSPDPYKKVHVSHEPGKPPEVPLSDRGCAQYEEQQARDNCEKARDEFFKSTQGGTGQNQKGDESQKPQKPTDLKGNTSDKF